MIEYFMMRDIINSGVNQSRIMQTMDTKYSKNNTIIVEGTSTPSCRNEQDVGFKDDVRRNDRAKKPPIYNMNATERSNLIRTKRRELREKESQQTDKSTEHVVPINNDKTAAAATITCHENNETNSKSELGEEEYQVTYENIEHVVPINDVKTATKTTCDESNETICKSSSSSSQQQQQPLHKSLEQEQSLRGIRKSHSVRMPTRHSWNSLLDLCNPPPIPDDKCHEVIDDDNRQEMEKEQTDDEEQIPNSNNNNEAVTETKETAATTTTTTTPCIEKGSTSTVRFSEDANNTKPSVTTMNKPRRGSISRAQSMGYLLRTAGSVQNILDDDDIAALKSAALQFVPEEQPPSAAAVAASSGAGGVSRTNFVRRLSTFATNVVNRPMKRNNIDYSNNNNNNHQNNVNCRETTADELLLLCQREKSIRKFHSEFIISDVQEDDDETTQTTNLEIVSDASKLVKAMEFNLEKVGVASPFRQINELIPSFRDMHKHLGTHLERIIFRNYYALHDGYISDDNKSSSDQDNDNDNNPPIVKSSSSEDNDDSACGSNPSLERVRKGFVKLFDYQRGDSFRVKPMVDTQDDIAYLANIMYFVSLDKGDDEEEGKKFLSLYPTALSMSNIKFIGPELKAIFFHYDGKAVTISKTGSVTTTLVPDSDDDTSDDEDPVQETLMELGQKIQNSLGTLVRQGGRYIYLRKEPEMDLNDDKRPPSVGKRKKRRASSKIMAPLALRHMVAARRSSTNTTTSSTTVGEEEENENFETDDVNDENNNTTPSSSSIAQSPLDSSIDNKAARVMISEDPLPERRSHFLSPLFQAVRRPSNDRGGGHQEQQQRQHHPPTEQQPPANYHRQRSFIRNFLHSRRSSDLSDDVITSSTASPKYIKKHVGELKCEIKKTTLVEPKDVDLIEGFAAGRGKMYEDWNHDDDLTYLEDSSRFTED